ncbi:hypothetical protein FDP41_010268 [Naegleria fowleri]|uniref:Uncharacterized protein n=1 Tax=Naegleria fowleri TaxID=5763 RepID=A0A6A5BYJ0_NAEFO|nr:uncharacterized protein FDP41_010268 [Naegleria fowleri]KAF0983203.1 hypothetical protein FDP41_010268 [Naegleria fowleri]
MTQQTEAVSSCGGIMQFDITCNFHSRNYPSMKPKQTNVNNTTPAAFFYWKESSPSFSISKGKQSSCTDLQKMTSAMSSKLSSDSALRATTKHSSAPQQFQPKISKPNKMKNKANSPKTLSFIDVSQTMTTGISHDQRLVVQNHHSIGSTPRKRKTSIQSYEQVLNLNSQPKILPTTTTVSCSTHQQACNISQAQQLHVFNDKTNNIENLHPSALVAGSYVHQESLSPKSNDSSVIQVDSSSKSQTSESCQTSDSIDSISKPKKSSSPNVVRSYIFSIQELLN